MNDTIQDLEPEYEFHIGECSQRGATPFENPELFYKRGKSSSNSQKWQCKVCKKITNVLPEREANFTYHQKRNDILPTFVELLLNRVPVRRACEILKIGSLTYYNKLEWVYRRCLEFLERHENKAFETMEFDKLWLNTDKMIYFLNNVRKKGQSDRKYDGLEEQIFPTHVVVSADVFSRYVLRADVAYDWNVRIDDLFLDTMIHKDDHLYEYCRKNARLRFSYAPQPPAVNDTQTEIEYEEELKKFNKRSQYIEGLHVNSTYTAIAHMWLIQKMVKAKEWRFITDKDDSLMTAIFRVFSKEIRDGYAHHFLNKIDRNKNSQEAKMENERGRNELRQWGTSQGFKVRGIYGLGRLKLLEMLKTHHFHEMVEVNGKSYPKWANKPLIHPVPTEDKGFHEVDCTTNISDLSDEDIAEMLFNVSDSSVNAFLETIRRRLSVLERPLVTARGEGKSYIYANFNPKYAQYALTILRTFYNFCAPFKSYDGKDETPAQRMGLTDKKFTMHDILYFK